MAEGRPSGVFQKLRYALWWRYWVFLRLRATHHLSWSTFGLALDLDSVLRSRVVRWVLRFRLWEAGDGLVGMKVGSAREWLLPVRRNLPAPKAFADVFIFLWLPVYLLDAYEMERFLKPGMTVIDGGAHAGGFSRLAGELVGPRGRVIALEPCEENLAALRSNLAGADGPQVTVLQCALWDEDLDLELQLADTNLGRQAVSQDRLQEVIGTLKVKARSIDHIAAELGLDRVDLIKLDIEGCEAEALRGSGEVLRVHRPVVIAAAYHKAGDLHDLPALLAELTTDYLICPYQAYPGAEVLIMAVPRERIPEGLEAANRFAG